MAPPRLRVSPQTRFGRLVVLEEMPDQIRKGRRYRRVLVVCDCGSEFEVYLNNLRVGCTTSCGCFQKEALARRSTTHGNAVHSRRTPEYKAWVEMRRRCRDKSRDKYRSYVCRGITVCAAWENSFEAFLAHVGLRPSARHSLDRKDNDQGYRPGNIRWATPQEQARNRRSSARLTIDGQTRSLAEWAELSGVRASTIRERLKRGWSQKDSVWVPTSSRTRWNHLEKPSKELESC